ncbi:MAG: hypothetical protein WAO67_16090 [Yoonia sp.]|nr:hypothetical protein [Yoonia sp.]
MSTVFDAMVVASKDGEIIRANATSVRRFGFRGSEIMLGKVSIS